MKKTSIFFNEILELARPSKCLILHAEGKWCSQYSSRGFETDSTSKELFSSCWMHFQVVYVTSCFHLHHPQRANIALTHLSSIGFVSSFLKNPISILFYVTTHSIMSFLTASFKVIPSLATLGSLNL